MATVTIGIDPGTSCGWAVLTDSGERIASGAWSLKPHAHEGGGMRFLRAERCFLELLEAHPMPRVAYELVRRHKGTAAAHVYGGIVAMLQAACERRGVPYMGVPVQTIKQTATGKGNSGKAAMVSAAEAHWSMACGSDDEADALWVAETLRRDLEGVGA